MHDAEPAARDPHMKVIRPGGLEAGSIPARISFRPDGGPSNIRPPLYSYHSGTKPRARFEWSGGLFLRYVRPLPTRLASRCEFGLEGDFFAFGGIVLSVLQPLVAIALSWSDSRRV